ncbi:MAG: IS256 family transposase [Acidobacteriota bacterium]|nr:IS256 family transposase [Acidobacteriota bacterium]
MEKVTSEAALRKAAVEMGPDGIEAGVRGRIRAWIEELVEAELTAALGADVSERPGASREGYRHGHRARTLSTSLGPTTFQLPRARLQTPDGGMREWQSTVVPRYQRRTGRVDEALLGVYLSGTNGRRIRSALAPLLKGAPLSKDAVSRLTGRLAGDFAAWRTRDLAEEQIRYLFLDGWYPKVRLGKQRVRVPVLVTLGVCADGRRILLDLRMAGEESAAAWREVVESLVARHIGVPVLAVIDGNPGLPTALRTAWPTIEVQRCTAHKLRNLQAKAPARWREELTEDYRRMIYAESALAVQKARGSFTKKWRLRCPAVVASLEEAGDELFTFVRFPIAQWKTLRTTNALERINEEFRRRVKTQGSLPSQDAVMLLLFGLLRSGQIRLRALVGYHDMGKVTERPAA